MIKWFVIWCIFTVPIIHLCCVLYHEQKSKPLRQTLEALLKELANQSNNKT